MDTNALYLLKAGDSAIGNILLIASVVQGNNLIAAINVGTSQIQAVRVSIADVGGYYSSSNVEGALQEIGATLAPVLTDHHYRNIMLLMGA